MWQISAILFALATTAAIVVASRDVGSGIATAARSISSPLQHGAEDIVSPIGRLFANGEHYGSIQQQNEQLQAAIGNLKMQTEEQQYERRQLRQIQSLLHIRFTTAQEIIAEVVDSTSQGFTATFSINKGTKSGIAIGMPVVTAEGLVGQVISASNRSSIVRLLTDGLSKIGVMLGPSSSCSGQPCSVIASGQGPETPLQINAVPTGTLAKRGQTLVTSGLSASSFPGGIPVAKIASVHTATGATQEFILANPIVDVDQNISYVAVLQWEPTPNPNQ